MEIIVSVLLVTIYVAAIFMYLLILSSSTLFTYFFHHEDWDKWKYYIENANKFRYEGKCFLGHSFKIPGTNIIARVWDYDGLCAIFDDRRTLCSTYDEYHSKKMAELLMTKIK